MKAEQPHEIQESAIQRLLQAKSILGVQLASHADQALSEVCVDTPVSRFVRIRQRTARDATVNIHMVQFLAMRTQARFDIAQAFPVSQLRKGQSQKLLETREGLDLVLPRRSG